MGAGFDASEFSIVIFASLSFKYVDYVQMKGRVKRINNLHENHFIHILAGKCDEAVYTAIMKGTDFDVHYVSQTNNLWYWVDDSTQERGMGLFGFRA